MISQRVKSEIETFNETVTATSPFYTKARQGLFKPEHICVYLSSIRYLVRHTPIHLNLAARRSEELGLNELAGYFRSKLGEEDGHDNWADEDLRRLKTKTSGQVSEAVSPFIVELVRHSEKTIRKNPAIYLSYIFFSEYMTVISSDEWVNLLQEKCGIPSSMMSILTNHVELDRAHVAEGIEEMNRFIPDGSHEEFLASLRGSMKIIENFYGDIAGLAP